MTTNCTRVRQDRDLLHPGALVAVVLGGPFLSDILLAAAEHISRLEPDQPRDVSDHGTIRRGARINLHTRLRPVAVIP